MNISFEHFYLLNENVYGNQSVVHHRTSGLKKAAGNNLPPQKLLSPEMTNAEYKNLTRMGDSYNPLKSIIEDVL